MSNRCQRTITTTFACLMFCAGVSTQAQVYSWTDADGNTVYSDHKTSDKARVATPDSNAVNYYSAPTSDQQPADSNANSVDQLGKLEVVSDSSANSDTDKHSGSDTGSDHNDKNTAPSTLTEDQCQQQYGLSCDRVVNWKKYARKACGDDPDCKDPAYLDRKYRPRTIDELRAVARRAAVRNKNTNDNIALFLKKKYSNYCENQAAMYCARKHDSNCVDRIVAYCKDPRSLEMILAKYNNLTPEQKRNIIVKAKAMATSNGDNQLSYEQMISSLIDILVTQAVMGL